jgi:small subunit ribosomal protein S16
MLMIRFQRTGRTNDPAFRIAVLEKARAAKAGSIVELLGTYNPKSKALTLNEEQVKFWISKGAQPTDSIKNLLINKGVIEGKKVNVLPRKSPQKSEAAIAAEAAAVVAAKAAAIEAAKPAPVVEATPVPEELPTEEEVAAEAEPAEIEAPVVEEAPAAEVAAEPASVVEEVAAEETPAA